jgi:hypothetical protein
MEDISSNSTGLYNQIVANSIFTRRQIAIILNLQKGGAKPPNISSGAYYRQVKQCKKKINSLLYSVILLQSIGIVKPDTSMVLSRLAEQLSVILSTDSSSDVTLKPNEKDVMFVINEVLKRVSIL